jgi:hypothetical protein
MVGLYQAPISNKFYISIRDNNCIYTSNRGMSKILKIDIEDYTAKMIEYGADPIFSEYMYFNKQVDALRAIREFVEPRFLMRLLTA